MPEPIGVACQFVDFGARRQVREAFAPERGHGAAHDGHLLRLLSIHEGGDLEGLLHGTDSQNHGGLMEAVDQGQVGLDACAHALGVALKGPCDLHRIGVDGGLD